MKRFAGKNTPSIEPAVDVVLMVLQASHAARPDSPLITSFLQQYQERGGLSKKQLEGLHSKASKIDGISAAHLATLQAIIMKKPTRYKTEKPAVVEQPAEDTITPRLIESILERYPLHKRVQFFKMKTGNRDGLSPQEKDELQKFAKLLLK
jgi:hypothetical protein